MGLNSELFHISTEEQYRWAQSTLNQQNRPPLMLRLIMNAFEAYRRSRKFGWSRPWNKQNVNNYRSFKLRPFEDQALIETLRGMISNLKIHMPPEAYSFAEHLLADKHLMGFIFLHEITEEDAKFEGATLSLGRVNGRKYRDRLDVVLESKILDESSQGLSRVRIFIDPYRSNNKETLWNKEISFEFPLDMHALFSTVVECANNWTEDTSRWWQHWTIAYIDYFGPRKWRIKNSFFNNLVPHNEIADESGTKKAAC